MKKLISIVILSCMIISSVVTVSAAENGNNTMYCNPDYVYADAAQAIYDAIYDFDSYEENTETDDPDDYCIYADISDCGITHSNMQGFIDSIFRQLTEMFFIDGRSISLYSYGQKITAFNFVTLFSKDEIIEKTAQIDEIVNGLIEEASALETMEEKAILVHNYLALTNRYNSDILAGVSGSAVPYTVYNIHGALIDRNAVCQGYALAFNHIMRRMGCRADFVMSTAMNHGWSTIELDGYWYHVDVTWDDPTYDKCGNLDYENLFLSDDGIVATGHTSFDDIASANATTTDYTSSDKYDDWFLHEKSTVKNNIVYNDGAWYFFKILGSGKYELCMAEDILVSSDELQYTTLKSISSRWMAASGGYYPSISPSMFKYDDRLFYSTADSVFVCDFDMSNEYTVLTPDAPNDYTNLYGILIEDDVIYYQMSDTPNCTANEPFSSYEMEKASPTFRNGSGLYMNNGYICGSVGETSVYKLFANVTNGCEVEFADNVKYDGSSLVRNGAKLRVKGSGVQVSCEYTVLIAGDLNCDGRISVKDSIAMKKALAGADTVSDVLYYDVDLDGKLTEADIYALTQLLINE